MRGFFFFFKVFTFDVATDVLWRTGQRGGGKDVPAKKSSSRPLSMHRSTVTLGIRLSVLPDGRLARD